MNLWYELNYTLRVIRNKLGFNSLCVLVIALGYLVTLPTYSFVNNFAYKTPDFPAGDRLVLLNQIDARSNLEMSTLSFDFYQLNTISEAASSFEAVGAMRDKVANLSDGEFSERYFAVEITPQALAFAETNPLLGRSLQARDSLPGAEPVVLLSYRVWQNYYASDADIVGKTARLNSSPHTIVGVMPEGFAYPLSDELWLPLSVPTAAEPGAGDAISLFALLQPGVGLGEATSELQEIAQRLSQDFPAAYENKTFEAVPYIHIGIGTGLVMFNSMAALAFCLFLLICMNVGNLLIIRAQERIGELSIRSAMGAKRLSLMSHVLLESLLICLAGAAIGIACASVLLNYMQVFIFSQFRDGRSLPFWWDFGFNADVLRISIFMILALWLLSGLLAAWRVSKTDLSESLGADSRGIAGQRGGKTIRGLVGLQLILSFFLLILSGVLMLNLRGVNSTGVVAEPDRYVMAHTDLGSESIATVSEVDQYLLELKRRMSQHSSFESVSIATAEPGAPDSFYRVAGAAGAAEPEIPTRFRANWIDTDYFNVINFSLQQGRFFDNADNRTSAKVAIVDDTFARRMTLDGSPIGRQIQLFDSFGNVANDEVTIVGVVPQRDESSSSTSASSAPMIYRPLQQREEYAHTVMLLKLAAGVEAPISELESSIRQVASELNRDVPFFAVSFLITPIETYNSLTRVLAGVFTIAALGAFLLSAISIFGLITRSVFARVSEIGIRRAVGSTNHAIVKIFLSQGVFYLAMAIVFGGGAGLLAVNLMGSSLPSLDSYSFLYTVLLVFSTVTISVTAVVVWASYMPVRKVIALEPGEALHYE